MTIRSSASNKIRLSLPTPPVTNIPAIKASTGDKPYLKTTERGIIFYWIKTASADNNMTTFVKPPVVSSGNFEEDPEIAAMSNTEIVAAAKALCGAWADCQDIDDDWVENMRNKWSMGGRERLADLYGPILDRYLFDSSILVDYWRKSRPTAIVWVERLLDDDISAGISIITEMEMWAGVRSPKEEHDHKIFLAKFHHFPNLT